MADAEKQSAPASVMSELDLFLGSSCGQQLVCVPGLILRLRLAFARSLLHTASPLRERVYLFELMVCVYNIYVRLRISFMEQRRRAAKTLACIQIIGSRRRLLKWWS